MFKRIVVPLDGTEFAEAALVPAQDLARRFDASIFLVRAVHPANLPRLFPATDLIDSTGGVELVDEADDYLADIAFRLHETKVDASYALFIAEPGSGIAQVAELDRADLICMATHQRWTLNLTRSDSTTLRVLARSQVPILAWRAGGLPLVGHVESDIPSRGAALPAAAPVAGPEFPIVVPLDGSPVAEIALPIAEQLATALNAELVLVRAVLDGQDTLPRATAYVDGMRDSIASRGVRVISVAQTGAPHAVIDAVRCERGAGLIVMASHGSRGERLGFLGSVAGTIIEETDAPVLVVRVEGASARAQGSRGPR